MPLSNIPKALAFALISSLLIIALFHSCVGLSPNSHDDDCRRSRLHCRR